MPVFVFVYVWVLFFPNHLYFVQSTTFLFRLKDYTYGEVFEWGIPHWKYPLILCHATVYACVWNPTSYLMLAEAAIALHW